MAVLAEVLAAGGGEPQTKAKKAPKATATVVKNSNRDGSVDKEGLFVELFEKMMALLAAMLAFCMSAASMSAKVSSKAPVSGSKPKLPRASPPVSGSKPPRPSPPASGSRLKRSSSAPKGAEPGEPVYIEREKPETPSEKRIKNLRKKLREIEALQERADSNGWTVEEMDPLAAEKVASKPNIETEIESLKQIVAIELNEIAAAAARAEAKAEADAAAAACRAEQKALADAALARKRKVALEVLPNISPSGEEAKGDARMQALLKQVSGLSNEVFGEDCLKGLSKKGGWRLSLLARPLVEDAENAPPEAPDVLLGFMVFRFRPDFNCMSIAKIAVPKIHRSKGFGRHLMEWVTKYAQQQGGLQHVSLSSLPDAVKFYSAFGFKKVPVTSIREDDDDLIEGQEYMEYRLKGSRQGPASGSRRK